MYELCRLLAPKKTAKARKPSAPAIRIGCEAVLTINGATVVITRKATNSKTAYFVSMNGVELPYSFSRDVLKVI